MSKSKFLSLIIVLSLALLAACAAPAAAPAAEEPMAESSDQMASEEMEVEQVLIGGFDVGPGGDPQGVLYNNGAGNVWFVKMFTPLIIMDSTFSNHTSEAALAVSWEPNDDATVWTFNLREGVKWHDGEDFTASDLKWTAEFVAAPMAAVTHFGIGQPQQIVGWTEYNDGEADEIVGIRAVDDLTLEIELSSPNPRFYDSVRGFYALPRARYRLRTHRDFQQRLVVRQPPSAPARSSSIPTKKISSWQSSPTNTTGMACPSWIS